MVPDPLTAVVNRKAHQPRLLSQLHEEDRLYRKHHYLHHWTLETPEILARCARSHFLRRLTPRRIAIRRLVPPFRLRLCDDSRSCADRVSSFSIFFLNHVLTQLSGVPS